jgi:hypothetical protein
MPDQELSAGTLAARVADVALELDDVQTTTTRDGYELRRGARVFAVVEGDAAELRLQPDVAEAVLRTPDTVPSGRGREWVRFEPRTIEPSVEDRLAAWVMSAWRAADRP